MQIGEEFYGNQLEFKKGAKEFMAEAEDELTALKRKSTANWANKLNKNEQVEEPIKDQWSCKKYNAVINGGTENKDVKKKIATNDGWDSDELLLPK